MPEAGPLLIGIDASRAQTPRLTGTERYSRRIIEELIRLGARHDFRLYVNSRLPLTVPLRARDRQRLIPFPRAWTHARLSAELLRHPVDRLFVPAHVIPPVHPAASVVTIHDLGYRHEPGRHPWLARLYLDLSTRWSAHAASRVIAISGATRDDLARHYGVPEHKIQVVYHGIDEHFQRPPEDVIAAARRRLRLPDRFILHVGTLQPRKNLARLIDAFGRLASTDPALRLVLAGKRGWLVEQIDHAIQDSPHRERIEVRDHVPDLDLPVLYAAAAVLAYPSLYEGFGLPALEAMACGAPVVVSDRGALPEIAGPSAIVVDPLSVEAIAAGLASAMSDGREARSDAGISHARRFTWHEAARRTLDVIEGAGET